MDIETSGAIKLFFPRSSLTQVYFEAVANALDAGATEVNIDIDVLAFDNPNTLKITVSDNGEGFTDENFARFNKLLCPRDQFHKGTGRLVFLNYFNLVEVTSTWNTSRRHFVFKEDFDKNAPIEHLPNKQPTKTTLVFRGFANERINSYNDLKPDALKPLLIERFLPTLDALKREGKAFKISINLTTNASNAQKDFFPHETAITPDDLPIMTKVTIRDDSLDAISTIDMYYHVESTGGKGSSLTAFSVDGRTIPTTLIPSASFPPGYLCIFLFESEIFHANSDNARQKLVLPDSIKEDHLRRVLCREIGAVLSEKIPQITKRNAEVKEELEEKFPHLLGYFETDTAGLIDQNDTLDIAQTQFFRVQKEILQCENLSETAYKKSLELSSRTLTEYILYREKIIARMKAMTTDNAEAEIHNLIIPRFKEFTQGDMSSEIYQNNVWLLDDKFMTFRTILSDKSMDAVINAIRLDNENVGDDGRPDIAMIFSANPNDEAPVDVVVVEIKKKTDKEKDNFYVVNQLLDRAGKLVKFCPNIQRVWYYGIMNVNEETAFRLRQFKWTPFFSKGKVYYQEFDTPNPDGRIIPTPTFIISFDAIVADAESRNHTFLEILRSGMKEYADHRITNKSMVDG